MSIAFDSIISLKEDDEEEEDVFNDVEYDKRDLHSNQQHFLSEKSQLETERAKFTEAAFKIGKERIQLNVFTH